MSNPNFFPYRLDEFPDRVWLPNWDLRKSQISIFPRSFGWISKPGLITQLPFVKCQIPIFTWLSGWISRPSLITQLSLDKCQIPNFPRPFGWISKPGLITQLRFDKFQIQFFPDRLDEFPNRSDYPIVIWQVSNPNFSPTIWINFQIGSDYPICDLTSVKSQFFPRPFGWISWPGLITQLRFEKVSNFNFSLTIWMNFQIESDYPITILQVSNPNFSPTVWMNF